MKIGCINFIFLCINVSLRMADLSLKHVGEFRHLDDL
jgi:hypothetical protein